MALSTSVIFGPDGSNGRNPNIRPIQLSKFTYPVTIKSDWQLACSAPQTAESDTGVVVGGKVVCPGKIIRAAQRLILPNGHGATAAICLRYNVDVGTPTNPVVRIGAKDKQDNWNFLHDSTCETELTITVSTSLNCYNAAASYRMTQPVLVDLQGCEAFIVAVQTAFAASSGTVNDSGLYVKLIT